jgi:hypothetical protein
MKLNNGDLHRFFGWHESELKLTIKCVTISEAYAQPRQQRLEEELNVMYPKRKKKGLVLPRWTFEVNMMSLASLNMLL